MRVDILERKDDIIFWIKNNESKLFICRELKCKPGTLETYLKKLNIEYKGNRGLKNKKTDVKRLSIEEYAKRSWITSHKLKLRLIEDGVKQHMCELCFLTEWQSKPIPIELDHIDGDHFNNDISNLRIVCPNCHAQTDTNSGKNRGSYLKPR